MPIRPEFRAFYRGKHWEAVRARVRARAGDRCEQCHVPNHESVVRRGGCWWDDKLASWIDPHGERCKMPRFRRRFVFIVCGVSHSNHTPGDDRMCNLRWLCASCHLNFDKAHHKETRSTRKDKARPLLQEAV